MCGLFGMDFSKNKTCVHQVSNVNRTLLSYHLADYNDNRGGHSWGFAALSADGKIVYEKGLNKMAPVTSLFAPFLAYMGHTRFGTVGKINKENAHPFKIGNIIGAHNGAVFNHGFLKEKYKRDFEVDSMHLFAHLDQNKSFKDIEGYGTIEWIDRRFSNRIYLCKLLGGELSIYGIGKNVDDVSAIVWSSSEKHLVGSLIYSGIRKYFKYDIPEGRVMYVENGKIFYGETAAGASDIIISERKVHKTSRNSSSSSSSSEFKNEMHSGIGFISGGRRLLPLLAEGDEEYNKEWMNYLREGNGLASDDGPSLNSATNRSNRLLEMSEEEWTEENGLTNELVSDDDPDKRYRMSRKERVRHRLKQEARRRYFLAQKESMATSSSSVIDMTSQDKELNGTMGNLEKKDCQITNCECSSPDCNKKTGKFCLE